MPDEFHWSKGEQRPSVGTRRTDTKRCNLEMEIRNWHWGKIVLLWIAVLVLELLFFDLIDVSGWWDGRWRPLGGNDFRYALVACIVLSRL